MKKLKFHLQQNLVKRVPKIWRYSQFTQKFQVLNHCLFQEPKQPKEKKTRTNQDPQWTVRDSESFGAPNRWSPKSRYSSENRDWRRRSRNIAAKSACNWRISQRRSQSTAELPNWLPLHFCSETSPRSSFNCTDAREIRDCYFLQCNTLKKPKLRRAAFRAIDKSIGSRRVASISFWVRNSVASMSVIRAAFTLMGDTIALPSHCSNNF